MYPSYGMEVRYTELETSVTRGCRSLQGYTEEFVCGIQSSYFRMEVTDVLMWGTHNFSADLNGNVLHA
jgi:hypothetical protein